MPLEKKYKTIVVHSGGMDSSICLRLACDKFGAEQVLSLGFQYGQRHDKELKVASTICSYLGVDRVVVPIKSLQKITNNALLNTETPILYKDDTPNTLVVGRNGLMARLAAIHADHIGAKSIYLGIIEVESANSGYRDCTRSYMDLMESILRIDLASKFFKIETPLVFLTKKETMELVDQDYLEFLLETTISCYNGVAKQGCQSCPACDLRNQGILDYSSLNPSLNISYLTELSRDK